MDSQALQRLNSVSSHLCRSYFKTENKIAQKIELSILALKDNINGIPTLLEIPPEGYNRSTDPTIQLLEGCEYEYSIASKGFSLSNANRLKNIVWPNRINKSTLSTGRIRTGQYVGTLELVLLDHDNQSIAKLPVEIRSLKVDYIEEYRSMLEDIAEKSSDLLLNIRSPVAGNIIPDPGKNSETVAQRFAFLKSLLGGRHFLDSLNRITVMPHHQLQKVSYRRNITSKFKGSASTLRNMAKGTQRIKVPSNLPLHSKLKTLPQTISDTRKHVTLDTPENRFVKFALRSFLAFIFSMKQRLSDLKEPSDSILNSEISVLEDQLETILSRQFFRGISEPDLLPLGSPVLQRKGGYRELLRAWLHFDTASKLTWDGGLDVYQAGRKDVAVLYEYWVFFKLLEIVTNVFALKSSFSKDLIEKSTDGFGLKLKRGKHLAVKGYYSSAGRKLDIKFSYNRSFTNIQKIIDPTDGCIKSFPASGSWTKQMKPDYTLSLWPSGISEQQAERTELIVHLHFDAKYRIDNLVQLFGDSDDENQSSATEELVLSNSGHQSAGVKRDDLLKMHAYKDAIRRTAGAYVLYPGEEVVNWNGYHELLPGLGAFPLKPAANGPDGSQELVTFLKQVAQHVSNRSSKRERDTYHRNLVHSANEAYDVHKEIPEYHHTLDMRHSPPLDTQVLCIFCENDPNFDWIVENNQVVVEIDNDSFHINNDITTAQYIFLYTCSSQSNKQSILEVNRNQRGCAEGPRIVTAESIMSKYSYPSPLTKDFALIFRAKKSTLFDRYKWDSTKLPQKQKKKDPISITLDLFMQFLT